MCSLLSRQALPLITALTLIKPFLLDESQPHTSDLLDFLLNVLLFTLEALSPLLQFSHCRLQELGFLPEVFLSLLEILFHLDQPALLQRNRIGLLHLLYHLPLDVFVRSIYLLTLSFDSSELVIENFTVPVL